MYNEVVLSYVLRLNEKNWMILEDQAFRTA